MLVVNFKAYKESIGRKAEEIASKCEKAASETGERVIIAPQYPDIEKLDSKGVSIFSQHIDPIKPGSKTGHIIPEEIKAAGADGTLINHSEMRISDKKIRRAVKRAKDNELETIVCAQTPKEVEKHSKAEPDFVAFEPPELIGGETSVSQSKPEMIEESVKRSEVPLLTGAGVKNTEDVEKSIELGCEGVLVASGIVKSENPYKETLELLKGLK